MEGREGEREGWDVLFLFFYRRPSRRGAQAHMPHPLPPSLPPSLPYISDCVQDGAGLHGAHGQGLLPLHPGRTRRTHAGMYKAGREGGREGGKATRTSRHILIYSSSLPSSLPHQAMIMSSGYSRIPVYEGTSSPPPSPPPCHHTHPLSTTHSLSLAPSLPRHRPLLHPGLPFGKASDRARPCQSAACGVPLPPPAPGRLPPLSAH